MKIAILSFKNQTEANAIASLLQAVGHECTQCDSNVLPDSVDWQACDLLVLMASDTDTQAAQWLRAAKNANVDQTGKGLPVLSVIDAAHWPPAQGLQWLNAGVDDYLIQPVRRQELIWRVNVLLSRAWPDKMRLTQHAFGPFLFDTASGAVWRDGRAVELAHKEFELALLFFRHLNQPLSRATLLERLWSGEADTLTAAASRTVDTHVSRVRNKLGLQDGSAFRLVPVYGYGYVLAHAESGE